MPGTCGTGLPRLARSARAESVTKTRVVAKAGLRWSATTRATTSSTSWVWWDTVSSVTRASLESTLTWRIPTSRGLSTVLLETIDSVEDKNYDCK